MDALEQYLSSGTAESPISEALLDRLKQTESSGNPKAVNKTSGAMGAYQFMPGTVEMLGKQGIKFDPMDEKQSREAARQYLTQLYNQTGSLDKALAAYGGFKTADPTKYVQSVKGSSDPLEDYLSAPVTKAATTEAAPAPAPATATTAMQKAFQAKQEIPQRVLGAADTLLNAIPQAIGGGTQFLERTLGIEGPQAAEKRGQAITEALSNPLGRLTGITGKEAYQKPLGGATEPLAQQLNHFFNVLGITPEQLAEKTGQPVEDIRNIGNILPFLAPEVAGALKTGAKAAGGAVSKALPEIEYVTPDQLKNTLAGKATTSDLKGVGAAKSDVNPYGPLTGEETVRGEFPVVKASKIANDVPAPEQQTRAQIAKQILGDEGLVREGVKTGNEDTLRNEYLEAKVNKTPTGQILKDQIANEQTALSDYAQKRVENTGASQNLVSDYERGQKINDAFDSQEGLKGFLKDQKAQLYDLAKQQVGDNPVASKSIDSLVNSPQFKAELKLKQLPDFTGGLQDLLELHKTEGFAGTAPNSVAGLEKLRKSLNAQWSPQNKYAIGQAVKAIDEDIAQAGGPGLYQHARALHQLEQTVYGSKGIKTLFGDLDPNGVQTTTPFEQIPKKLNSMPYDEWRHIYDTAEALSKGTFNGLKVPEQLQSAAQAAINEMKGNIAREIHQAGAKNVGVWNQNEVNKTLNARANKIKYAFDPEEQRAFHTLNYGGHLMPGVHSYEGAALQAERLGPIMNRLPTLGRELGAATGVPFAASAGEKIGETVQKATTERKQIKKAEELTKKMKENAKLGTSLNDLKDMK